MFKNIKRDIKRYIVTEEITNWRGVIELFFYSYSLWVILSYRSGRWVRESFKVPIIKQSLKILTRLFHELLCLITGIHIPFETKIGPGLYIGHTGMLIINSKTIIGENCTIGVGVVIGQGGRGEDKGCPIVGNSVFIGVGAKVIGKIKIGDYVAIGANAVVNKDIPSSATVVGIPAKVINFLGSNDFIRG